MCAMCVRRERLIDNVVGHDPAFRESQNLTHWSVLSGRSHPTTIRRQNRIHGRKNGPSVDSDC
jgi:hypothetical protein